MRIYEVSASLQSCTCDNRKRSFQLRSQGSHLALSFAHILDGRLTITRLPLTLKQHHHTTSTYYNLLHKATDASRELVSRDCTTNRKSPTN